MSTLIARITAYALVAGVLGLLTGLLLAALTDLDNPFWAMSVGIGVGAVLAPLSSARRDAEDR